MIHLHSELEMAWAAGFFDGEGCTATMTVKGKRGRPEGYLHLQMSVKQVRLEPLERFREAVNLGSITFEKRAKPNTSDIYCWNAGSTKAAREALDRLWPYLSLPKREQARCALERFDQDLEDNPRDHFKQLRERIVQLRAEGLSPLQIASAVGRSRRTIYYHLRTAGEGVTQ